MNEITPAPVNVPPQLPLTPARAIQPLGETPDERQPVVGVVPAVEAILRQPRRVMFHLQQPGSGRLVLSMLLASLICSLVYGLVAGTFSMGAQLWAAPVKIAGGLSASALICLPSLYIFACLSGSRATLREIAGLVGGMVMLTTLLLIGFSPVAWLFSQSTESLVWMGGLHLAFWLIATLFGMRFLQTGFAHSEARSRAGLNVWIVIFVLVALQMTTALRPILGKADTFLPSEKQFFLTHWSECVKKAAESREKGI